MTKHASFFSIVSAVIMIACMAWLTVSIHFIYAPDNIVKADTHQNTSDSTENNPLSGNTEEKNPSSTNLSEYLHDLLHESGQMSVIVKSFKCQNSDIYLAFKPELISPPPDHKI